MKHQVILSPKLNVKSMKTINLFLCRKTVYLFICFCGRQRYFYKKHKTRGLNFNALNKCIQKLAGILISPVIFMWLKFEICLSFASPV